MNSVEDLRKLHAGAGREPPRFASVLPALMEVLVLRL
jgi:hypothetical protein